MLIFATKYYKAMKKITLFFVAAIVMVACNKITTEEYAKQQAKAFTEKNCPSPVKNDIRTDLVYEEDSRTFHYYYSLFGMLDNPDSLKGRGDGMRERMLQSLKNAGSMEEFKKAEMNFKYTYHSSSKPDTVLYEVTFRPSEYNK